MTQVPRQQINLYQPIFRKQRQTFSARVIFAITGAVSVALLAIHGLGWWQVTRLETEAAQLEGRARALEARLASVDQTGAIERRKEIDAKIEHMNDAWLAQQRLVEVLHEQPLSSTQGFSRYLAALARRHTKGLWLTEVSINGRTAAIELAGRALEPELVPEYLQSLSHEPALSGQRFDRLEIERSEGEADVAFRVSSLAAEHGEHEHGDRDIGGPR